jgi:hypothetical protein
MAIRCACADSDVYDGYAECPVTERLEYLRGEIEAERISYGEISELQDLAAHIDDGDVVLLEWAGVPEHRSAACRNCSEPITFGPTPGDRNVLAWFHPGSQSELCGPVNDESDNRIAQPTD